MNNIRVFVLSLFLLCPAVKLGQTARAAESGSAYRIVLIHSNGSLGAFKPGEEFDRDFQLLGAAVTKISVPDVKAELLQGRELVITSSMLLRDASNTKWWSNPDKLPLDTYGPIFKRYLAEGGTLLLTDIIDTGGSYSLTHISPELKTNVAKCETGLTGSYGKSALATTPHRLANYTTDYNPFQICRRVGGKFAWGRFTRTAGWNIIERNPAGQPVMLSHKVGKGTLIATTLCAGRGIDAGILENILFAGRAAAGQPLLASDAKVKTDFFRVTSRAPRGKLPFDAQGNILVEGKPFFPFGFYKVEEKSYPLMKANGFNSAMGINAKVAEKYGLKGTTSTSWDMAQARDWTAAAKDSPSILAQEFVEEPGNLPVPPFTSNHLRAEDDLIKSIVPNRPTYVLVNNPLEFPSFGTIGDMGFCDPYPFEKADSSTVRPGHDIDYLRRLSGNANFPVWAVLQAHWFGERGGETYLTKPTADQLLAQTYIALVHRANGIFYFAFDQGDMPDTANISFIHRADGTYDEPLWTTLKQLAKEVETLRPALLSPLPYQDVKVRSKGSTIQFLLRRAGSKFYLFAVNPEAREVDAAIDLGSRHNAKNLKVLFGNPKSGRDGSRFTFAPYQRVVFEF